MNNTSYSFEPGEQFSCDICIIGAGAAGITIARELIGSRLRVCLVESGGIDWSKETQDLYQGSSIGVPYLDLDECRLRYFGGTTNHWAGMCGPLESEDFLRHDWIKNSGWPIKSDELIPFYHRAQKICELGPFNYEVQDWVDKKLPDFDHRKLSIKMFQMSPPTRFGARYRADLKRAQNVRVILNANLFSLDANEAAFQISKATFKSFDGKKLIIKARRYVLACGGIENARMLLLSNQRIKQGLGNERDLVGRYFMEHIIWMPATLVLLKQNRDWWYAFQEHNNKKFGVDYLLSVSPDFHVRRRNEILNFAFYFYKHYHTLGSWSVGQMRNALVKRDIESLGEYFGFIFDDFEDSIKAVTNKLLGKKLKPPESNSDVELIKPMVQMEQSPNPNSRVKLTREKDNLGLNRVSLDWRLSELDLKTIKISTNLLAEELGRLGLGRLYLSRWLRKTEERWPAGLIGGSHHMGTTRMSVNPAEGVVNSDSRIHGIDNLYIAGSSIFPTGGYVNPTLTIVALSIRLAEHLKAESEKYLMK